MNDERDDDGTVESLSDSESAALAALPRERSPRPAVEAAIVAELSRRGHVRNGRPSAPSRRALAIAAALLLLTAAGAWWMGRSTAPSPAPARWILLLHDAPSSGPIPREESERRVKEYGQWARGALAQGLVDGDKLGDEGTWMHASASGVESRPLHAGEDTLGGFFLLGAMDEGAARTLASTCPHLRYGGVIELRRIDI